MQSNIQWNVTIGLLLAILCHIGHGEKIHGKLGLLSLDASYNRSEYNDRLTLSKSTLKYSFRIEGIGDYGPLISTKTSTSVQLLRCDNVSVDMPEMLPLFDCRPIEQHLPSHRLARQSSLDKPPSSILYAKRFSKRSKQISHFAIDLPITDMHFYQLKDAYVRENIDQVLADHDQAGRKLESNDDIRGYYVEVYRGAASNPLKCTGKIFTSQPEMAANKFDDLLHGEKLFEQLKFLTEFEPEAHNSSDLSNLWQSLLESMKTAFDTEFLISLQDFSCKKNLMILDFDLKTDFSLIRRKEFPYWSCHHEMVSGPSGIFLKYNGSISQRQGETDQSYTTTVYVKSDSIFTELNFQIDQTFNRIDEFTGNEDMSFVNINFIAIVKSVYSAEKFTKMLSLFYNNNGISKTPNLILGYHDEPDTDYIKISLLVKKKNSGQYDDDEDSENKGFTSDDIQELSRNIPTKLRAEL